MCIWRLFSRYDRIIHDDGILVFLVGYAALRCFTVAEEHDDTELLLVDEPVAGLSEEETERTGALLRSLAGDHTVLVIEHDMDFIHELHCPVTVLHEGHVLCEVSMDAVQNDPRVIEVYLGVDDDSLPPQTQEQP